MPSSCRRGSGNYGADSLTTRSSSCTTASSSTHSSPATASSSSPHSSNSGVRSRSATASSSACIARSSTTRPRLFEYTLYFAAVVFSSARPATTTSSSTAPHLRPTTDTSSKRPRTPARRRPGPTLPFPPAPRRLLDSQQHCYLVISRSYQLPGAHVVGRASQQHHLLLLDGGGTHPAGDKRDHPWHRRT